VKVAVQVNGKLRATIDLPRDAPEAVARAAALAAPNVIAAMADKKLVKFVYVANRIANVVISSTSASSDGRG
jgi:leucyl-tRNA synthetase